MPDPRPTIAEMSNGQHAFTTPWGLRQYGEHWFLHPDYPALPGRGGTVELEIALIRGQYYAWPGGKRVTVRGLAGFGGPDDVSHLAREHEKLAEQFDELGEPEMAAVQRRLAEAMRAAP